MASKKVILVAHDIEKTGSFIIANPIISVGFFVGDDQGNTLLTRKFNIQVKWPTYVYNGDNKEKMLYNDFEPRCWDEFWSKLDPAIKDRCLVDAKPAQEAWFEVSKFLDELEILYPEDTHKIVFVTDNASFDTASIDYALEKYCQRAPMRYSSKGKYRSVKSGDDMYDMMPDERKHEAKERIDKLVKHDHDPVNDAHFIYLQYVEALKYQKEGTYVEWQAEKPGDEDVKGVDNGADTTSVIECTYGDKDINIYDCVMSKGHLVIKNDCGSICGSCTHTVILDGVQTTMSWDLIQRLFLSDEPVPEHPRLVRKVAPFYDGHISKGHLVIHQGCMETEPCQHSVILNGKSDVMFWPAIVKLFTDNEEIPVHP
jgi:hypothetical protein